MTFFKNSFNLWNFHKNQVQKFHQICVNCATTFVNSDTKKVPTKVLKVLKNLINYRIYRICGYFVTMGKNCNFFSKTKNVPKIGLILNLTTLVNSHKQIII